MAYPGGKDGSGVWQGIVNQIPPHDVWISAFAGDCAVTRHIRPAAVSLLLDLDAEVLGRWIRRQRPSTSLLHDDCVQWLRFAFGLNCLQEPQPDCATAAADAGIGGGQSHGAGIGGARADWRPGAVAFFRGLVPAAAGVGGSGDGVSGDGRSTPRVFVYADPPYLPKTRAKDRVYRHELDENQHRELLRTLLRLPCCVLIHGYPSQMYSDALGTWRTWTYRAMTRGGLRAEQIWCNYPQPVRLHDYSQVGSNKRQRERIRRRCRNWAAGLARAGTLERGAILQALGNAAADARFRDAGSGGVCRQQTGTQKTAAGDECPGFDRGGTGVPCCDRAGQYNGMLSSGNVIFVCPKHCGCHD
jgi:DNA adenine methylase